MDFRVHRSKSTLDSTGYVEIGPGTYSGEHWQDGFVFVEEGAFLAVAGIVAKHFPAYDHFGMNDVPSELGRKIAAEWRDVGNRLQGGTREEVRSALCLSQSRFALLESRILSNRSRIAGLLNELADECEKFLQGDQRLSILGV